YRGGIVHTRFIIGDVLENRNCRLPSLYHHRITYQHYGDYTFSTTTFFAPDLIALLTSFRMFSWTAKAPVCFPSTITRWRPEGLGSGDGVEVDFFLRPKAFAIPSAWSLPRRSINLGSFSLAASSLRSINPFSVRSAGMAVSLNTAKLARFMPRSAQPSPATIT